MTNPETVVFTDGACKGNPGPGGWAWAIEGGAWSSGYEPATTNQRMEITAAYRAVMDNPGSLRIVSDSMYVVNCFRDEWWRGWQQRNWRNSKKEPVANRDLWEPFVELVQRREVVFEWVRGHSGHEMNDLVDRLAVAAIERRGGAKGTRPPEPGQLRSADGKPVDNRAAARDRRVPTGQLWSVVGLRCRSLIDMDAGTRLRHKLASIIDAQQQLHGNVVVLSGGRPGAEQIGAMAAADVGVPYVVILPYPDPVPRSSGAEWERFSDLCRDAESVVTLESKRPSDGAGRTAALARRDGWLRSVSSGALVVTAGDASAGEAASAKQVAAAQDQLKKFSRTLGDEVWEIPIEL